MSLHLLRSEREDHVHVKHRMAHEDRVRIGFAFVCAFLRAWLAKNRRPLN